jgi:trigger factor
MPGCPDGRAPRFKQVLQQEHTLEITLNKTSNTEGLIKIRLTEGDYQPHVEEKVRDYARKVNLKGFRPGKVPAGVVKRMFGKSILVDEINHLLSHKLSDYIKENNLKLLGDPLPNQQKAGLIDWDAQREFEFEYQIGLVEDFTYELSSKVKIKSYAIEVDQKVIDETLADLKKRFGKVTYPEVSEATDNLYGELTAKDSDFKREYSFLAIDKIAKKEQKKFVGVKKEDTIEFDIQKVLESETEVAQLLGVGAEEVKDKKGAYLFKVTNITRVEPAEENQELFDRVFGKDAVTTSEAFLEKVKSTISENYSRETQHFLDHNIEDYYLEHTKVTLPDEFLKLWLKTSSKGEVTEEILEKEFKSYRRGLLWDIIKNKIAEDNHIKVESEEVRNKAKQLITAQFGGETFAEQMKDRLDAIADNYLTNEDGQNFTRLFHQLRNDKIITHIKQHIAVDEKKVSVDEFKKIVEKHTH